MTFREEIIGDARLILGDCREIIPTLARVDACVTDPPYGIGESSRKVASRGKLARPINYGDFDWDREPCPAETIAAMRASSRHQIIFGGNFFDLPPTSCWLVWDKLNGSNDFADCELAWTNLPKAVRRIQWRWNGMIRRGDDEREHPTQKPEGVMSWMIEQLPEPTVTILDPFMGSGTTGVACARLGRKFIGVEIHEPYFDIARRRIEQAYRQRDLFIAAPVPTDPSDQRAADLFADIKE
jgi:DNA modification methylase